MPSRDWSALDWTPKVRDNILPQGPALRDIGGQTDMYGVPQWYWDQAYTIPYSAQNDALFRSMGYTGAGPVSVQTDAGDMQKISPELYKWLSDNGISEAYAHDPGSVAGSGRPEYFSYVDRNGKLLQGQADPTVIMTDTTMDNITPFLMMAGPFMNAAGVIGAGAEGGAATLAQAKPDIWGSIQSGALKGAGMGAIKGLATGQNPLTSALRGALTGGVGGGISSIGQGALGSMFGGDAGSMDLIPNAFGDATDALPSVDGLPDLAPYDFGNIPNVPRMALPDIPTPDWTSPWSFSGLPDLTPYSPGQLPEIPSQNLPQNLPQIPTPDWTTPTYGQLPSLPQADYSNEGRNYATGGLDPVGNSPAYTGADTPFIDLSGGTSGGGLSDLIKSIGGAISPIADAVGGGKNLAGLIGAGWGALNAGGTETKTNEPWIAAQPFLKNALGGLDDALTNLRQHPHTPQQTAAYGNAFAGLDQARAALPGLLSWGQGAMQKKSSTPSYADLFGGGLLGAPAPQQPTAQAGGIGGLLGPSDRMKALMTRGQGMVG